MANKTAEQVIFGFGYYPSKQGTGEGQLIVKAMNEFADLKTAPLKHEAEYWKQRAELMENKYTSATTVKVAGRNGNAYTEDINAYQSFIEQFPTAQHYVDAKMMEGKGNG